MKKGKIKKSSLMRKYMYKFAQNRLAMTGLVIVTVLILLAIFAPILSKYDPVLIDPAVRNQPPSAEHLLGTDRLGRDVLTRLMYGGRVSILVGLASALLATGLGVVLGCVSGWFGAKSTR